MSQKPPASLSMVAETGISKTRVFKAMALISIIWASAFSPARADPLIEAQTKKPKVALVLSGGGALGLAHVGAIEELERLGIRPDMVVGTSMGSIVGGLYASGLDNAALERAVKEVNWDRVFNPAPDRDDLTYRQKVQEGDFPVKASLAITRTGIKLPAGLISDQALLQELRRFVPVKGEVASFDHLAIPFRAVATDIETGKAIVIDHGEVPMAMRASMAVPGVFAPVNMDGHLLVDGGMAANIPISVARDMGADIVIVVATQSSLLPSSKISSAVDLLGQTVTLLILANERDQLSRLTDRDVLVTIEAGGLNAADFTKGAEFVLAGRRSLLVQAEPLKRIAAGRDKVTYVPPAPTTPPPISYVRVDNSSRLADTVLARRLTHLIGHPAEDKPIQTALNDVYALGAFERVDYALETKDGKTGVLVRAQDTAPDAGHIRVGLTLAKNDNRGSDFDVSFDYRTPALDRYGSEVQLQATFGDRNIWSAEYFKVLDPSQSWFTTSRVDLENRPVDIYDAKGFKLAGYDLSYGVVALGGGYQFGRVGEVRLQVERGQGKASLSDGIATPRKYDLDIGRLVASGGLDTLDNPYFPERGVRLGMRWAEGFTGLGDNSNYQTLAASGLSTFTAGRNTVITAIAGGSSLNGHAPIDSLYRLGGLFSLSGYRRDELAGEAFASGRLVYRYRLSEGALATLGSRTFVGASLEASQTWARHQDFDLQDLRYGASLYLGADTALGPAFVAYGASDDGRQAVYLFIGRPF